MLPDLEVIWIELCKNHSTECI